MLGASSTTQGEGQRAGALTIVHLVTMARLVEGAWMGVVADDHGRRSSSRARRRAKGDGGAVLVEAALIMPIFCFIIFGIIEGSLLLRDHITMAAITGDAGRSASIFGKSDDADYKILQQIDSTASSIGTDRIERIVVFKATGPNDTVPASCKAGTPQTGLNACNVYDTADLTAPVPATFTCLPPQPWRFYCPSNRKVAATSPPDHVGIYVRLRHDPITGFFGGARLIERTVIFRLEPQVLNE
jgi:hypothetical protein